MIFVASSSFMRTKYQRTVHIINNEEMSSRWVSYKDYKTLELDRHANYCNENLQIESVSTI